MSSHYRKQLELYLANLDVNDMLVYDVGGAQLPVRDRVKSWQVDEYRIVDLHEPHVKKVDVDIIFDIERTSRWYWEKGDIVFCLEVMEYIADPMMAVANLAGMLVKGGTLYITFPTFYPPHEPYERDAMRYTRAGARRLLRENGFKIEEEFARASIGSGIAQAISDNALRVSQSAPREEVTALGFIFKATKL
jgi:hypothetical protein